MDPDHIGHTECTAARAHGGTAQDPRRNATSMSAFRTRMRASRRPGSRPVAVAVVAALAAGSLSATVSAHAAPASPTRSSQATDDPPRSASAAPRLNPTESASAQAKATGKPVTIDQLTDTGTVV